MSPILLSLPHFRQKRNGECLAVCAYLALYHIKQSKRYKRLIKILRILPNYGTPLSNIRYLEKFGVTVEQGRGTVAMLREILQEGYPIITLVATGELPDWTWDTQHAILVVGMDDEHIWVHDPEFVDAPRSIPIDEFDLAWLAMRERYAVIRP